MLLGVLSLLRALLAGVPSSYSLRLNAFFTTYLEIRVAFFGKSMMWVRRAPYYVGTIIALYHVLCSLAPGPCTESLP